MLQHVIKAQVLKLILRGMDLLIRVLEIALNHKRARIPGLARTRVVRTGVATLGLDERDVAVSRDDLLDKGREAWVNIVRDDAYRLRLASVQRLLHITRHVLLQHRLDFTAGLLVSGEDCLTAKEATLLRRVPVELDGVGGISVHDVVGGQEDPESF